MMKKMLSMVLGGVGAILAILGISGIVKGNHTVSIIGGADGPTSIFVAGKVGADFSVIEIVIGIILVALACVMIFKKKR